jgi:hypothetical protein
MDENPYESPRACDPPSVAPSASMRQQEDEGGRILGRIVVGVFGGGFAMTATWVAIVAWTGHWTLAELLAIPSWIAFGILAAYVAYAAFAPIRVASWAFAGLGFGLLLEAILSGGLPVGTWLTISGIALGLVFAVLDYRRGPRRELAQTQPTD